MDLSSLVFDAQAELSNYMNISLKYKRNHDLIFLDLIGFPEERERMAHVLSKTEGTRSLSISVSAIKTAAGIFFTNPRLYMQLSISPVQGDDFYFSEFVSMEILGRYMSNLLKMALDNGGCIEDDNLAFSVTSFQDNLYPANILKMERAKCY